MSARQVLVAGLGQTGPVLEDPRSIPEMVLDVVEQATADANLGLEDIDAAVTASVDLFDGLTASNVAVTEVVGAVMKPETRIAADGLCAAIHGACQVMSGAYGTVLVVAHGKASMSHFQSLTQWALDPVFIQPLGADFLALAGLQAAALAQEDPEAEARWAKLAEERRQAAGERCLSNYATAAEVLASDVVAAPVREGMCAPLGDGACAVVLKSAGAGGDGVRIGGMGWDLSHHLPLKPQRWPGLERAFKRAGGAGPVSIDLAEPSCLYAHEEELFRSALGLAEDARLSLDGGLLAGTAPVAAGLSRLIAAAGEIRQGRARRALAHASWGPAGQGQAITFLEAA